MLANLTPQREALARLIRATVLRPVLAMQQGAIERNALFEDPTVLRAQRDSLAAFLVGQATLAAENRHLRELLGLRERLPRSFVSAEIVRLPGRASDGFFQITAGSAQGVVPGATIVAGEGLVGRVSDVDDTISFGLDWMHPQFRASGMTLDGEIYGILQPRVFEGEPVLLLTGTPRHIDLQAGSLLVTAGQGQVYPLGIPIGVVIGPESGEDDWQRNYLVRPLVSPSEMNYVLVLGEPELALEGQDLARVWGIAPVEPIVQSDAELAGAGSAGQGATSPPSAPRAESGPRLLGEPVRPPQD